MPIDLTLDDDEDTVRRRRRLTKRAEPATVELRWSARSSIGLRRADNQDAWGEIGASRFVVADGVGGMSGGAAASSVAVSHYLAIDPPAGDWSEALREIDARLVQHVASQGLTGAATTLVGLDIVGTTATVVHVGDSRCYLLRDGALLCLTEDHNVGNLRRVEGHDPRVGDDRGKPRSLTSYLGSADPSLVVGVMTFTPRPGDRMLLCSDGVHEQVPANRLAELLGSLPIETVPQRLVGAADDAGGRDNATALALEVQSS